MINNNNYSWLVGRAAWMGCLGVISARPLDTQHVQIASVPILVTRLATTNEHRPGIFTPHIGPETLYNIDVCYMNGRIETRHITQASLEYLLACLQEIALSAGETLT